MILIIWGKQVAQRYLQNNICYLWSPISPWSRPCSKSLFRAFFLGMVYIVIIQKISFEWDRLQAFSNIDHDFDNICFLKKLRKKLLQNLGNDHPKCAKFLVWWFFFNVKQVFTYDHLLNLQKSYWSPCPIVHWRVSWWSSLSKESRQKSAD